MVVSGELWLEISSEEWLRIAQQIAQSVEAATSLFSVFCRPRLGQSVSVTFSRH